MFPANRELLPNPEFMEFYGENWQRLPENLGEKSMKLSNG
jgi:hypothetical protein